jgi:signal transduction histidine kinase
MAGQLNKRLTVRGSNDDFDKLARIVNEMLDEIERLMLQAKGAGEDIAHDLRTPLTRLRGRLERALSVGPGNPDITSTIGTAIEDIDQILGTITAILRIGEVEHGQRRAGFREVDLADVVRSNSLRATGGSKCACKKGATGLRFASSTAALVSQRPTFPRCCVGSIALIGAARPREPDWG